MPQHPPDEIDEGGRLVIWEDEGPAGVVLRQAGGEERPEVVVTVGEHPGVGRHALRPVGSHQEGHVAASLCVHQQAEPGGREERQDALVSYLKE